MTFQMEEKHICSPKNSKTYSSERLAISDEKSKGSAVYIITLRVRDEEWLGTKDSLVCFFTMLESLR